MLGINYQEIESNSVGYKTDIEMYALDFEEFLWAKGYDDDAIENIYMHLVDQKPFSPLELALYQELFLDFCVLGGMPEVVRNYIEKETFEDSLTKQRQLLLDYREDIRKYATGIDQTRILSIYDHIPTQLAKENKKFQISKVAHGARFKEYIGCLEWLKDSGIVQVCYCLNYPELPLKGNYNSQKYKLYYSDTGLLVASLDDESQDDLRANKNLGVYKGALYENMVAEAFYKSGLPLYYYRKDNSTLEVDFFVRTKKELIPVEVKAKKGTAKSLKTMIASPAYPDIKKGIKVTSQNIGFENSILTIPYFTLFLLKKYLSQDLY